jgi:hypothetical protein
LVVVAVADENLERRGEPLEDVSDHFDEYVTSNGIPIRFPAAHGRYGAGIAAVRRAKDESQAAY